MNVSRLLPAFLARRLEGRDTIRRSLDNAAWLFADQAVRMVAALLVGVWMARYLGPEKYGWLSYATALVGTVTSFTSLGINAVVVRELVRFPGETPQWMGAAFFLKSVASTVGFLICVLVAWIEPASSAPTRPLVVIVALGMFFQTVDVIDLLFQARGQSRVSAWVRIIGCLAANSFKAALIFGHASLPALAAAGVVELAVCSVGWLVAVRRVGMSPGHWTRDAAKARLLLRESWPLALSGLAIYTQAYADQIVIAHTLGGAELGQYAAAMRLVGVPAFIPMVVYTVAAPEITRAHRDDRALYRQRMGDLYRLMFLLFLVAALPLIAIGGPVARWLLGGPYEGAALLLPWLVFRLFFTNFGVARSIFITNEGLFRFGLVTAIAGAVVNVALNLWLIPRWGARGAIVSSIASFAVSTFLLEGFQPLARANLGLMIRAVVLPWRSFRS
ncbi:MAG TPA: flippase [Candidatus Didemnitutus sp.]|jgi:O-antigen/teichoic acid export membrane protein